VSDWIIWAGVREDIEPVYNALDILCSSSYWEGFSNVIGEAMACGVPCVVTDVGDSAMIVGDQGIVVPPGDAKALAEGLKSMILKLDDFNHNDIRDRIIKKYTVEKMVDRTEELMIELCNT